MKTTKILKAILIGIVAGAAIFFIPFPFRFLLGFFLIFFIIRFFCIQKMAWWLWSAQFQQALLLESILHATLAQHER
jgi:hypothetical protein